MAWFVGSLVAEGEEVVMRAVAHEVVDHDEVRHRLDDRRGAGKHARIVPPAAHEGRRLALEIDGLLLLEDGGGGLKGHAEDHVLAIGDAALHAARAVRARADAAVLALEKIVVLRSFQQRALEAAADLEALRRRDGQHGLREVRLEPVEHRLAEADWQAAYPAFDDAAHGIALRANLLD